MTVGIATGEESLTCSFIGIVHSAQISSGAWLSSLWKTALFHENMRAAGLLLDTDALFSYHPFNLVGYAVLVLVPVRSVAAHTPLGVMNSLALRRPKEIRPWTIQRTTPDRRRVISDVTGSALIPLLGQPLMDDSNATKHLKRSPAH